MREEQKPRPENQHEISVDIQITNPPKMIKAGELKPNQGFWQKDCSAFRVVVGDNVCRKTLLERFEKIDNKKLVVYYDVSLKHIGTISADEIVIATEHISMKVS